MRSSVRKLMLLLCLAGIGACLAAQQKAAPKKAAPAASKKSAFDKAAFEPYLRHLFVFGPQVKLEIADPKPSATVPGFSELNVHLSWPNGAQDLLFYVSKDGQKFFRGDVYDINRNPFKPDLDKLNTQFQPSFGTPGAPVVIVVFTDFECPFCKHEAEMLRKNLPSAYPKQVRLYFKDFPLQQIHPWARLASITGRCIFRQNPAAFWQYHDWIYEHQAEINAQNFKPQVMEFAKGKEIDLLQLTRCMDTRATEAEVDKNIAEGRALGITSTPTMFVNGRRLVGQLDWNNLRQIIDYELEYQKTAKNAGEDCGCTVEVPSPVGTQPANQAAR